MKRINSRDVSTALESVVLAHKHLGIDASDLVLQVGSKTYGRAFRIFRRDAESGGLSDAGLVGNNGYLGMTKRETYDALRFVAAGLWRAAAEHDAGCVRRPQD